MSAPREISEFGSAKVGAYRNAVCITYDLFPADIFLKLGHPSKDTISKLKTEMLALRKDQEVRLEPSEEIEKKAMIVKEKLRYIIGSVLGDMSSNGLAWKTKMFGEAKAVLDTHIGILKNYGEVVSHEIDSIYFIPREEEKPMLEDRNYFCKSNHYQPYVEERYKWLVVFGKRKHLGRNLKGELVPMGVKETDKGVPQALVRMDNSKFDASTYVVEPLDAVPVQQ